MSVWGSPDHRVKYSVNVSGNGGTLVCCKGYSAADVAFHGIGCGHDTFSRTLNWGNYKANPKIKCKGFPIGAHVSWSH